MSPPRPPSSAPDDGKTAIENARLAGQRARLAAFLEERYGARGVELSPIYEEADKAVYRVDRAGAGPWVLRYFPPARPLERVAGDAAVLRYLEECGVPAERVVPAADGAGAASLDGRGVLVTRLIDGARPDRSPATLRLLGEAVGRLHALPPVPAGDRFLTRRAGALPRQDLELGRACLARVAGRLPSDRLAEYDAIAAALDRTHDCDDLPHGLTQSDRHLGNALRAPDGAVVQFDWDGAGQGPLLPALGWLLFSCVVQAPDDQPIPPDLGRVEPVVAGYCRYRVPTAREVARMADAVRVRPVVVAARELAASVERGNRPDGTAWWARWAESDAVAARACQHLERYL